MEQNPSKRWLEIENSYAHIEASFLSGGEFSVCGIALGNGEDGTLNVEPMNKKVTCPYCIKYLREYSELAKDNLVVEKPKQPQPGDIVQYISSANARYMGANPPYSCGEVLGIKDGIMKVVFSQTDEEYFGTEGVHKWRWPGEKEWRR